MKNLVILIGNVGSDPEVKHLDSGQTVAKFSLATNESYSDKSGKKVTQTEWHNITVWRNLAEIVEKYLKKGMLIYVEGRIHYSNFEDKNGNKQYRTDIICDSFRFLGKNQEKRDEKSEEAQTTTEFTPTDDLPF